MVYIAQTSTHRSHTVFTSFSNTQRAHALQFRSVRINVLQPTDAGRTRRVLTPRSSRIARRRWSHTLVSFSWRRRARSHFARDVRASLHAHAEHFPQTSSTTPRSKRPSHACARSSPLDRIGIASRRRVRSLRSSTLSRPGREAAARFARLSRAEFARIVRQFGGDQMVCRWW